MRFIEYYHTHRKKLRLVDRRRSWLMKTIHRVLIIASSLGLVKIKNFMEGYITTIGRSIYASPPWTLDQIERPVTVHELCHVEQWSLWYALSYIFSKKKRILFESICVQAEIMCFPQMYGSVDTNSISRRAAHFEPYGVNYRDAVNNISDRIREIKEGKPRKAADTIFRLWVEWQNSPDD